MELTKTLFDSPARDVRKVESRWNQRDPGTETRFPLSGGEASGGFGNFFDRISGNGEDGADGFGKHAGAEYGRPAGTESGRESPKSRFSRIKSAENSQTARVRPAENSQTTRARPAGNSQTARVRPAGKNAAQGGAARVNGKKAYGADTPPANAKAVESPSENTPEDNDTARLGGDKPFAEKSANASDISSDISKEIPLMINANTFILWGGVPAPALPADAPPEIGAVEALSAENSGSPGYFPAEIGFVQSGAALRGEIPEMVSAYAETGGGQTAGEGQAAFQIESGATPLRAEAAPKAASAIRAGYAIPVPSGMPPETSGDMPVFDDTAVFLRADDENHGDAPLRELSEPGGAEADAPLPGTSGPDGQNPFAGGVTAAPPRSVPDASLTAPKGEAARSAAAPDVVRQIMDSLKAETGAKGAASEVRISLRPESLGEVALKIAADNGAVTAQFVAESRRVKEIIEAGFDRLRDSLSQQGLQVSRLAVSVNPDGHNGGMGQFLRERRDARNQEGVAGRVSAAQDTGRTARAFMPEEPEPVGVSPETGAGVMDFLA